ncbi:MAG: metallophosphoesterase [Leptonema sp. (in: Bacteria)]|nr:metallophosphoesterase [Leptonema sp. (in: bacteria)]
MQIAIIGDIHTNWNSTDIHYFNQSSYDLILICGDLPGRLHTQTLTIASLLSKLKKPAVMIPGNHDSTTVQQLVGEIIQKPSLIGKTGKPQLERVDQLALSLAPIQLGGYSIHRFSGIDILTTRPHSMGGPNLSFQPYLKHRFSVETIEDSANLLKKLVDQTNQDIIFLGHNGPSGLGADRSDIFGCDFKPEMGDFGDTDSRIALDYAIQTGKKVKAFIGGHMHHHLRGGGKRKWLIQENDIWFVNAARVPRIFKHNHQLIHHHVRLIINSDSVKVNPVFVSATDLSEMSLSEPII